MIHRVIAFGAREEFAAARRRLNRSLLADLDEKQAATLGSERERDLQTAILVLLHFDLPCYRGQSIGNVLLRREASSMPVRQRSALANAVANATSLYEIVDVFPGRGIELRDLLRRFTVRVRERKASTMVQPGWLLLTKVRRQPDGTPVLDIPLLHFDEAMRSKVDSWLSARRGSGSAAAIDPRAVLVELYHMWQMVMATELTRPAPTILLQNHHGEPIEECEAELQCDESRLRSWLQTAPYWMVNEEADAAGGGGNSSWTWYESARDGTRLTLAHIDLSGDRVLLHVNSRARLDRATAVLREAAGAVVLRVDVQTREQLLAKARARAGRPGRDVGHRDDIPSEGGKNAVRQVMETHYRRWVDEPLPKFGNRTPRQMASVDPGAVSRAIWRICNGPEDMKYDARWMYDELGVPALGEDLFAPGLLEGAGGAGGGTDGQ